MKSLPKCFQRTHSPWKVFDYAIFLFERVLTLQHASCINCHFQKFEERRKSAFQYIFFINCKYFSQNMGCRTCHLLTKAFFSSFARTNEIAAGVCFAFFTPPWFVLCHQTQLHLPNATTRDSRRSREQRSWSIPIQSILNSCIIIENFLTFLC